MLLMAVVTVAAANGSNLDVATGVRAAPTRLASGHVALVAITALLLSAPFETLQPILRLPGQSLSAVESVLLAGLAAWIAALVWDGRLPRWRTSLSTPWLLLIIVAGVASLSSPVSSGNALRMTARCLLALLVFLLTRSAAGSSRGRGLTIAALTCSGVLASVLVVLDFLAIPAVLEFLRVFRAAVAVVGTAVRASGPFQYPTIASMYLEIAFASAVGLLVEAMDRHRWRMAALMTAALLVIAEGIVLTFTRAGLVTAFVSLAIVGIARMREPGGGRAIAAVIAIGCVLVVQVAASRSLELLQLRLTTEGSDAWFRASIRAPAALAMRTGERTRVSLDITNTGRVTWDPQSANPVRVSYHWLDATNDRVIVWEGERTTFAAPVPAGRSLTLDTVVQAPPMAGSFRLVWDIEQFRRLWFSTEPGAVLTSSLAEVSGPTVGLLAPPRTEHFPRASVRPSRRVLWTAALAMLREHPLLGIGPDNFRLQYGRYAALPDADPRVHSNSLYVETLAGTGLLGGAAFAWLAWRVRHVIGLALRTRAPVVAGLTAALVAVSVHGVIDTFLGFTGVYVAVAAVLGLVSSAAEGGELNAHRV